jgi:hypothetical protein
MIAAAVNRAPREYALGVVFSEWSYVAGTVVSMPGRRGRRRADA